MASPQIRLQSYKYPFHRDPRPETVEQKKYSQNSAKPNTTISVLLCGRGYASSWHTTEVSASYD